MIHTAIKIRVYPCASVVKNDNHPALRAPLLKKEGSCPSKLHRLNCQLKFQPNTYVNNGSEHISKILKQVQDDESMFYLSFGVSPTEIK